MISKLPTRGFTLMEMMIIIGIIGIGVTIVVGSLWGAPDKARDAARANDLRDLNFAVRQYYQDNGRYPAKCANTDNWGGAPATGSFACTDPDDEYILGLVPEYLLQLPVDENAPNNSGYIYRVDDSGQSYKILSYRSLEATEVTSYDHSLARCDNSCTAQTFCQLTNGDFQTSYAIYHDTLPDNGGGAECW